MAKQMSAVSTIAATCSNSACSSTLQNQEHPARPFRRRRPRLRTRQDRCSGPSSTLLSFLATIAASSASASPAPPAFLCPSIDASRPIETAERQIAVLPPRPTGATRRTRTKRSSVVPRFAPGNLPVPDRYERGEDGRWRRVDMYTLYGSTVCSACPESPSIDDQIQVPGEDLGTIDIPPEPSTTSLDTFMNTLPNGWMPPNKPPGSRTSLILALSLVLAFFICFFIIGCLFWRKNKRNKRRKYRENDLEMRVRGLRRPLSPDEGREAILERDEREVRVKQKLWARATARWRANARYSARQRRGRRSLGGRNPSAQNSNISLGEPRRQSIDAASPVPSRPPSRRSSLISEEAPVGATIIVTPTDDTATTSSQAISSSPPAYGQRLRVPVTHISPDPSMALDDSSTTPSITASHSRQPSRPSTRRPSVSIMDGPMDGFAQPTVHRGHVATDDKALLARLATLASAPPSEPSAILSSAPELDDEEYEPFDTALSPTHGTALNSSQYQQSRSPSPSPLPPPSQGKLPATLYHYSYALEDLLYLEPESEPSAPPFEETTSAPVDDAQIIPSAPPLFDLLHEGGASAPPEEIGGMGLESHVDEDALPSSDLAHTNHERRHLGQETMSSRTPSRPSTPSVQLPLPIHGPISSDGTPPSYQP